MIIEGDEFHYEVKAFEAFNGETFACIRSNPAVWGLDDEAEDTIMIEPDMLRSVIHLLTEIEKDFLLRSRL